MIEPQIRVYLYDVTGRRSCVLWCRTPARARELIAEAPATDVLARAVSPEGHELEMQRPAPGEPWAITGRRQAA